MRKARLYDTPAEFAAMMMRQLGESLKMKVCQRAGEPLLLEIEPNPDKPEGKLHVSLHDAYRLYRATGDLNAAVDYLNDVVRNSLYVSTAEEITRLDPAYIYPVIRETRYVEEAGSEAPFLSDDYLPGLSRIYLEIKDGCSKIVSKSHMTYNPDLTEAKVRSIAVRNLQQGGWQPPCLSMESPLRSSCTVDVYGEPSFPMDCQFLLPEWATSRMPDYYVLAFTNRKCTLVMRSEEPMETAKQAITLIRESGFLSVVQNNCNFFPHPVSDRLYLVRRGKARLLEMSS